MPQKMPTREEAAAAMLQEAQERTVAVRDATRRSQRRGHRGRQWRSAEPVLPTLSVPGLSEVLTAGEPVDLAPTRDAMQDIEGPRRYRGPRFRLRGTVLYRPLRPYDPAPTMPLGVSDADELVAFTYIGGAEDGFSYPPRA